MPSFSVRVERLRRIFPPSCEVSAERASPISAIIFCLGVCVSESLSFSLFFFFCGPLFFSSLGQSSGHRVRSLRFPPFVRVTLGRRSSHSRFRLYVNFLSTRHGSSARITCTTAELSLCQATCLPTVGRSTYPVPLHQNVASGALG